MRDLDVRDAGAVSAFARGVAVAAVALTMFVPCPTAGCGRWGRSCGGCRRRRFSPTIFHTGW